MGNRGVAGGETQQPCATLEQQAAVLCSVEPCPTLCLPRCPRLTLSHTCVERKDPTKRATTREILQHDWLLKEGVALDAPLDNVVLTRMRQFGQMNKLKKMCLMVVGSHLSLEEIGGEAREGRAARGAGDEAWGAGRWGWGGGVMR